MGYNYYGNFLGYAPDVFTLEETINHLDLSSKQKVDIINFYTGFKSSDANEGLLKYEANIGYTHFTSKYGFNPAIDKGPRGGIIEADVNFYTKLGTGNIGIAGAALNQTFNSKSTYDTTIGESNFGGLTNITVNPYYKIEELNWELTIGANMNYVRDASNKFLLTPNMAGKFHLNDVHTFYASFTGGINNNTFIDILRENRYADIGSRIQYSKTVFDIKAGYKSGIIPNLEFDVFAGYKQVKDDHTYMAFSFIYEMEGSEGSKYWSNVGSPIYGKISTGHVGGLLKTKLIPKTTLTAKAVGYFYNVKNEGTLISEAWGRPNFTAELTADVKPIDKLTLSLSYLLMTGRKGMSVVYLEKDISGGGLSPLPPKNNLAFSQFSMKNINELNVRAEYEVIKWFSVYARVNNLLNQKYEQQLGYTLQGINVLGGVSLRF